MKKSVVMTSKGKIRKGLVEEFKERHGQVVTQQAKPSRPASSRRRRQVYQAYQHISKAREILADLRAEDRANTPQLFPTDLHEAIIGLATACLHLRHYSKDKFVAMIEELKAYR